jgi:hypothetical protein
MTAIALLRVVDSRARREREYRRRLAAILLAQLCAEKRALAA